MIPRPRLAALSAGLCCLLAVPALARDYHDEDALERTLRAVTADRSFFALTELTRDAADRPVSLVQVGSGDPSASAVLVVAGLDGRHLVGTEMALALLEDLAADTEATRALLGNRTLYVVPRVNHHGAQAFFSRSARHEVAGLSGSGDHDKDGLVGEDDVDDLNGDGGITVVRVADPQGKYVLDGDAGDFLREADGEKGEWGEWKVLGEGQDDDGDDAWNEEADGGPNVARSFPQGYEWFARDTGAHQVSTDEARALADFLALNPNIGVVVVFGFEDNLLTPWSDKKTSDPNLGGSRFGRKPVTDPNKHDVALVRHLSERYREDLNVAEANGLASGGPGLEFGAVATGATTKPGHAAAGGFAAYAYYARGRTALATPVWTPGLQLARNDAAKEPEPDDESEAQPRGGGFEGGEDAVPDSAEADSATTEGAQPESPREVDAVVKKEQAFRDWLVTVDAAGWLGWRSLDHPDFPDAEAFVGGFAPFAKINPPPVVLDKLVPAHVGLVKRLFQTDLPQVDIQSARLVGKGAGVYELIVDVVNKGYLPDVLAQGVFSAHVRATRVELGLPRGAEVLGGHDRMKLERIPGSGGHQESRFLLQVPGTSGTIDIKVISEVGGTVSGGVRVADAEEGSR